MFLRKVKRLFLICLAGLLLTAPCNGSAADILSTAQILSYGNDPAQIIYFYAGNGSVSHKLLVFVHGGGWVKGDVKSGNGLVPFFKSQGYAVVSLGYRMYPVTNARGGMQDLAKALAYLQTNANALGIDMRNITLFGHSAGGHLVALLATDPSYLQGAGLDPKDIRAVVTLDGVYDIPTWSNEIKPIWTTRIFGPTLDEQMHMSPTFWAKSMRFHPQFCIMHENTLSKFVTQADLFVPELQQAGEHVESLVAPGLDHGQIMGEFLKQSQPMQGFFLKCLADGGVL